MTSHDPDLAVRLSVNRAEVALIRMALRHLLASEDDPETIEELKRLLARLARAEAEAEAGTGAG